MHILLKKGLIVLIVVEKYGGTSVDSLQKLKEIALHIKKMRSKGKQMIIIISAKGKTTDNLIANARTIDPFIEGRELDALLSIGEIESASLLTMVLNSMNIRAISLNAWQIPIYASSNYQNGKIININTKKIIKELKKEKTIVIPGFQGINNETELITLGRGGSDTIAIAMASAFKSSCFIYTDVPGVFSIDPKKDADANHLKTITYDEMIELSSSGNKVIASRAILLAKELRVKLYIKKLGEKKMTKINERSIEKRVITGITVQNLNKCFLSKSKIKPFLTTCQNLKLMIEKISYKDNEWHIYYLESEENKIKKIEQEVTLSKSMTKYALISIIGLGLKNRFFIVSEIYELMLQNNFTIYELLQSDLKITILTDEEIQDAIIKKLSSHFKLRGANCNGL